MRQEHIIYVPFSKVHRGVESRDSPFSKVLNWGVATLRFLKVPVSHNLPFPKFHLGSCISVFNATASCNSVVPILWKPSNLCIFCAKKIVPYWSQHLGNWSKIFTECRYHI